MKTGRLIRIGLLFACSLIILFWGINFLKGKKLLQPEKLYYAEYSKIGGLTESSPVTINGFTVGKVSEISLNDFRTGKIMVKFVVNYPDLELPLGSQAKIISTDLMGTKAIAIILSDAVEFYSHEDTLPGLIEGDLKDQVNNQMLPLKQSAENLMSSMDSVLVAIQLVFGPGNRENLAESFSSLTQTIKNLEKTSMFLDQYVKSESEKFSYILSNTDSLSAGLIERSTEFHQIISNLTAFSDTISQLPLNDFASKLNIVLSDLHKLFDNILAGKGNLGKLSQDDSLYTALKETSESLNMLIKDVKLNPKRYIHISAFDKGRTIIASNDSELLNAINSNNKLDYYVCLDFTSYPLPDDDPLFRKFKNISIFTADEVYYYYIKKTKKLDHGKRLLSKYTSVYPNAGLYTLLNGNWHKIKL